MLNAEDRAHQLLHRIPFFADLPEFDVSEFSRTAKVCRYSKQQLVFLSGDTADRFFAVLDGWIKLYRTTDDGKETVISLATRGDIFGEADILCEAEYPYSAEAVAESSVAEIPVATLRACIGNNPVVTSRVISSMAKKIRDLQTVNGRLSLMNAPQRVASLLLQLSGNMSGKGGTFPLPYGKSLAAAKLGMTRETFSRALASLRALGVSTQGHEITIENFSRLDDYCRQKSAGL